MNHELTDYEELREKPSKFVEEVIGVEPFETAYRKESCLRHLYHKYNLSQGDISDIFGISQTAVSNWMNKYDIETRGPGGVVEPPVPKDELESLYEEGYGSRVISDKIGCSRNTILRWSNILGIDKNPTGGRVRSEELLDEVITMYESGMTQSEIASVMDVDQTTVSDWLSLSDVTIRNKAGFGSQQETLRGEVVKSSHERDVANFLYENGIDYTYEPQIDETDYIPDFLVDENIVEVWGITRDEEYNDRIDDKVRTYTLLGYDVISVYPGTKQEDMKEIINHVE